MDASQTQYDDNYATCHTTRATLCAYSSSLHPSEMTSILGVEPSETGLIGEKLRPWSKATYPHNGWFLCSKGVIHSRDSRRHLDWILDQVEPGRVHQLQERGARVVITCYWRSNSGHGGPTLGPSQLAKLAELNIEFWYDFYNSGPDAPAAQAYSPST